MTPIYSVRPRFSGGSPATVDAATALKVASDEREGYARALSGVHGPEAQAKARQDQPLRGIVVQMFEQTDGWVVVDVLTLDISYVFAQSGRPTAAALGRARTRLQQVALTRRLGT